MGPGSMLKIVSSLTAGGLSFALLCCAAVAPPAVRADGPQPVLLAPFVTLTGTNSHVAGKRCVRITTQEEWIALWLQHVGAPPKAHYNLYGNPSGVPVVDFGRCMVIALIEGSSRNSWGYEAESAGNESAQGATADESAAQAGGSDGLRGAVLRIVDHSFQTLSNKPLNPNDPWPADDEEENPDGLMTYAFFIVPRTQAELVVQYTERPMGGGGTATYFERARFPALPDAPPAPERGPPGGH
jgi:hypothetical protein